MNADDVMDFSEPYLRAMKSLARAIDQASLGRFASAREHVAAAADHLVAVELALNKLEAEQRMRSERTLFGRHRGLPTEGLAA